MCEVSPLTHKYGERGTIPYSSGCQFPPSMVVPNWWCFVCYKRSVGDQFLACCLACCGNAIHHKISKSMSFIAAFFDCQHKALVGNTWMWCSYDRCFGNVNNKIAHPTPCFSQMSSNIFPAFCASFKLGLNFFWRSGSGVLLSRTPKLGSLHIFLPQSCRWYICIFLGCFENSKVFSNRFWGFFEVFWHQRVQKWREIWWSLCWGDSAVNRAG